MCVKILSYVLWYLNKCAFLLCIFFKHIIIYFLYFSRVLGKFGGGNRKMMTEPQRLDYSMHRESKKTAIIIKFNEYTESVAFNVDTVCKYLFVLKLI